MEKFEFPAQPENPQENKEIIQNAIEKWETIGAIQARLKGDRRKIEKIIDTFRPSNPEYFEDRKVKGGPIREHVSPEIIKIIEKELEDFKNIPEATEGWETITSLSEKLGVVQKTIARIAESIRKEYDKHFVLRKASGGGVFEYYSPELVKIIQEKVEKFKNIPEASEEWETSSSLSKKLNMGQFTIANLANQYRKTNPEYFEYQKRKSGGMFEFYSSELVELLKKGIEKFKEVPEDYLLWSTNKALAKELQINEHLLAKLAEHYRKTNPEYFKDFRNKGKRGGSIHEHYSPELINIIKEEINKENLNIPVAPEDWQSVQDISERAGISKEEVDKIAKKLRENYPEGYGKFKKNDE